MVVARARFRGHFPNASTIRDGATANKSNKSLYIGAQLNYHAEDCLTQSNLVSRNLFLI
jgi:hypothetical protein